MMYSMQKRYFFVTLFFLQCGGLYCLFFFGLLPNSFPPYRPWVLVCVVMSKCDEGINCRQECTSLFGLFIRTAICSVNRHMHYAQYLHYDDSNYIHVSESISVTGKENPSDVFFFIYTKGTVYITLGLKTCLVWFWAFPMITCVQILLLPTSLPVEQGCPVLPRKSFQNNEAEAAPDSTCIISSSLAFSRLRRGWHVKAYTYIGPVQIKYDTPALDELINDLCSHTCTIFFIRLPTTYSMLLSVFLQASPKHPPHPAQMMHFPSTSCRVYTFI